MRWILVVKEIYFFIVREEEKRKIKEINLCICKIIEGTVLNIYLWKWLFLSEENSGLMLIDEILFCLLDCLGQGTSPYDVPI